MFKGRSQKIEFNNSSQPPVTSNVKAYASNIKRHSSMRQHHSSNFHLDSEAGNANSSYTNHKFLSSKKYVSCENVRQQDDEFQEISCDEEDENGIKVKLMKRYNSLTTLLMKSFRKAKNKKKKSDLQISQLETNFEEEPSSEMMYQSTRTNSHISEFEPNLNRNLLKNVSKISGASGVRSGSLASSSISRSLASGSISRADSETLNEIQSKKSSASIDKSMPVFKGVKIISNEFVDLKLQQKVSVAKASLLKDDVSTNSGNSSKKNENTNTKVYQDIKTVQPNFSIDSLNSRNEANEIYNKLTKILGDSSKNSLNAAFIKANSNTSKNQSSANDSFSGNKINNYSSNLLSSARSTNELEKINSVNANKCNNSLIYIKKRNTLTNTLDNRPLKSENKKISLSNENFLESLAKETNNHFRHKTLEKILNKKMSESPDFQSKDKIAYNFSSHSKPQAPKIPTVKSEGLGVFLSENENSQHGSIKNSTKNIKSNEMNKKDIYLKKPSNYNKGTEVFNQNSYSKEEMSQKREINHDNNFKDNNQSLYTTIKREIQPQSSYGSLNENSQDKYFDEVQEISVTSQSHHSRYNKMHQESISSLSRDKCKSLTRDFKEKNLSINDLEMSNHSQLIKILNLEENHHKFSLPAFVLNSSEECLNHKENVENNTNSSNFNLNNINANSYLYKSVDSLTINNNENVPIHNQQNVNFEVKKDAKSNQSFNQSRTFTQQLQEILKERKTANKFNEISKTSDIETVIEQETYEAQAKRESPNLIDNTLSEIFDYQYVNTPAILSTSSPKPFLKNDQLEKNYDYIKKGLLDLNKIEKITHSEENFDDRDSHQKDGFGSNSDDFKDLVSVLTRQDQDFKRKFFDCLMPKLWDTKLPYSEYIQLNKLMTALFGESYHKLDLITASSDRSKQNTHRPDAEQIVNLMKAFLVTSVSPTHSTNSINASNDHKDDFNDYPSVCNLINTLKRRKYHESQIIKNDDDFINGFNKNIYFNPQSNKISSTENSLSSSKSSSNDGKQYNIDTCEKNNNSQLVGSHFNGSIINNPNIQPQNVKISKDSEENLGKCLEKGLNTRQNKVSSLLKLQKKNSNIKVYSNQMPNVVKQIIHKDDNDQVSMNHDGTLNCRFQVEAKEVAHAKSIYSENLSLQISSFQPSTSLNQNLNEENQWATSKQNINKDTLTSFNKQAILFDMQKEKLNQDYEETQRKIYNEHQRKCEEVKKYFEDQQKLKQLQLMDQLIQQKKYKENLMNEKLLQNQYQEQKLKETKLKEQLLMQKLYQEKQIKERLAQSKMFQEQQVKEQLAQKKLLEEHHAKTQQIKEQLAQQKLYEEMQAEEKQAKEQLAQKMYREQQLKEQKIREQIVQQKLFEEQQVKEQKIKDQLSQKMYQEKMLKEQLAQKNYQDQKFKEHLAQQKLYQDKLISEKKQLKYHHEDAQLTTDKQQQLYQQQKFIKDQIQKTQLIEQLQSKALFDERFYQKHFETALAQQKHANNSQKDVESEILSKLIEAKENIKNKTSLNNIETKNLTPLDKLGHLNKPTVLLNKNTQLNFSHNISAQKVTNSPSSFKNVNSKETPSLSIRTLNSSNEKKYETSNLCQSVNKNSSTLKSQNSTSIQTKSKPNYNQLNELFAHKVYKLDQQQMQQAYY
jgi:hypothetical protein